MSTKVISFTRQRSVLLLSSNWYTQLSEKWYTVIFRSQAAGRAFIDHDGMRVVEGGIGVAGDHGQGEDLEDRRVGEGEVMLEDMVVALPHQLVARVAESDHLLDLRIGSNERGAHKFGGGNSVDPGVIEVEILIDPINAVGVDVVAVVTKFVGDVQDDQQADAKTGGEADDVEGGKALTPPEAAEGSPEIVAEHGMVDFITSKAARSPGRRQKSAGYIKY